MPRSVSIYNGYPSLGIDPAAMERLFAVLDAWPEHAIPDGELSLAFLDDNALANVHRAFLDDPAPTDVITFPGDPEEGLAGEICVSVDTARSAAAEHGQTLSRELALYLVHGWLHLAGLADKDDAGRAVMREAEKQALDHLAANRALPAFTL